MRKIKLITLLILLLHASCSKKTKDKKEKNYLYKWKVEVIYSNGDKDTINCDLESRHGTECYLTIKTSESGLFYDTPATPCLVSKCMSKYKTIACNVRRYEVLSLEKQLIEED